MYAYLLTPSGVREKAVLTQAFLARKMEEFDALRTEIATLQAEVGNDPRSTVTHDGGH